MTLSSLAAGALDLVWPAVCAACGRPVAEAVVFCRDCDLALTPMVAACPGCALPTFDRGAGDGRCRICRRVRFPFATATAVFAYGESVAVAVMRMKHGSRRFIAARLARLLAPALAGVVARARLDAGDAIVPVPLHPRRLRARGFNQALELARAARASVARAPAAVARAQLPRLERDLLRRARDTRALGHAGPAARLAEVAGAFTVADAARVRGRRFVLVDDVFTTGATFTACSETLLAAGARAVHVLALARAV